MADGDSYYLVLDGKNKVGPIPAGQIVSMLKGGTVNDATPIWAAGMDSWTTVGAIRGRLVPDEPPPFDPQAVQPPPPPAPPPPPSSSQTAKAPPAPDDKNRDQILDLQRQLAALPEDDVKATLERQRLEKAILDLKGVRPKVQARRRSPKDFDPHQRDPGYDMVQPEGKSAVTACLLSLVLVGLGQMYLGQAAKGLLMLLGAVVIGAVTLGVATVLIWIIAAVDAYKIGKKLEDGYPVGKWEWF